MSSFQAHGVAQGAQFEKLCDALLGAEGFTLGGRLRLSGIGVDIDRVASSPRGTKVWFEYKGSVHGTRPGLRRTDTLKKAIANGALIATVPDAPLYVLLASHLPERGHGAAMLRTAIAAGYFTDVICINEPSDVARLADV